MLSLGFRSKAYDFVLFVRFFPPMMEDKIETIQLAEIKLLKFSSIKPS